MIYFIFIITGIFVGFLSGLLGVGGGLTIVPVLFFTFLHFYHLSDKASMQMALATSLAIIIPTLVSSIASHHQQGNIIWRIVLIMTPGLAIGSLLSSLFLASLLPVKVIKIFFGVFCIYIGVRMFIKSKHLKEPITYPSNIALISFGLGVGALSSLLGIAGGSLTANFLSKYNVPMKNIIGSTAAIGLPIAIFGSIGFIVSAGLGQVQEQIRWSIGYIYLPAFFIICLFSVALAPVGSKFMNRVPASLLKKLFAIMLFIVGAKML